MTTQAETVLIPTTVMGSYPQPRWLIDHERLKGAGVPRVREGDIWSVAPEHLDEAIEAATFVAIADQEAAGVDIITDGEIGRESYFNHFANALGGVDRNAIGVGMNRVGGKSKVPLVNGPIVRTEPVELDAARFLVAHSSRRVKVTVPGPFTLSELADDQHYGDRRELALAYADAVNEELRDLAQAGVDMLQIDEPYLQANAGVAREIALEVITRAVRDVEAPITLHTCYGYALYVSEKAGGYPFFAELAAMPVDNIAIETAQPGLDPRLIAELAPRGVVLGVLDLGRRTVETAEEIAIRIRQALEVIEPDKLSVSPDCGMKFLPRAVAQAKLAAMVAGAAIVRSELV
ncbi:MAG: 5-methyltetrahydropteroyltriglutamate--homocysteine methyltransferase [Candidatus Poriferisodalaceae bacterium]